MKEEEAKALFAVDIIFGIGGAAPVRLKKLESSTKLKPSKDRSREPR